MQYCNLKLSKSIEVGSRLRLNASDLWSLVEFGPGPYHHAAQIIVILVLLVMSSPLIVQCAAVRDICESKYTYSSARYATNIDEVRGDMA